MKNKELVKFFEEKHLAGTCFKSLKELLEDRTSIDVNAYRALLNVKLVGVWTGMKFMNERKDKS